MDEPQPPRLWFRAKTYGYGWYPVTWQGWGVTIAYALLVIISALDILRGAELGLPAVKSFIVRTVFLTFFLVHIAYTKGEKPRWQWGRKPTDHEDPIL